MGQVGCLAQGHLSLEEEERGTMGEGGARGRWEGLRDEGGREDK